MNIFIGNTYVYKNETIGVCKDPRDDGLYMIGHEAVDEVKRVKNLPLFLEVSEAQKALDDFAKARGLPEVQG